MEPEYVAKHFVPLALDTYFRGNSHELEFCNKVHAGGNHLVVVTAAGKMLGKEELKLRKKDLEATLKEFADLPKIGARRRSQTPRRPRRQSVPFPSRLPTG